MKRSIKEMAKTIEEMGKKITQVGQGAIKGTKKMVDVVTVNAKIADQKLSLNDIYSQIGEIYYNRFSSNPLEELKALCEEVSETLVKIESLEAEYRKLKGLKKCAECENEIGYDAAFCSFCGSEAPKEQAVEEVLTCPGCGKIVSADMTYCSDCGLKL